LLNGQHAFAAKDVAIGRRLHATHGESDVVARARICIPESTGSTVSKGRRSLLGGLPYASHKVVPLHICTHGLYGLSSDRLQRAGKRP
jgi:hypothetical protein